MSRIWQNIEDLAAYISNSKDFEVFFGATSMGADPLHIGHLRCILHSSLLCDELIVIVNGDNFLLRKKGYVFMPLAERMEIIAGLRGVSHVIAWDDGTQYVDGALEILRPDIFTKGGDRSTIDAIAETELQVCKKIGCKLVLGVGGTDKAQSSSALIRGSKLCQFSIEESPLNPSIIQK